MSIVDLFNVCKSTKLNKTFNLVKNSHEFTETF